MKAKMVFRPPVVALSVGFLSLASASRAADLASIEHQVPNFARVDERLYRGGQPDRAGFEALRTLGVRTVINLRTEDEREAVEAASLKYIHIPTSLAPFSDALPAAVITAFFDAVNDLTNGPVFVHCRRGSDRTGFLVALYRISHQAWTADRAYREARELGMRWWYSGVKDRLDAYADSFRRSVTPDSDFVPAVGEHQR
jgi:tyrosine-protein phosphatase SIW14